MRILEFITPSNIGGAENYLVNLSKKLKEKGHEVYILSSNPRNRKNPDLSVAEFLSKSGLPFKLMNIGFKYSPLAILKVLYFSKKNNIEIIHTHLSKANIIGAVVSKILRLKSAATAHGLNKKSQYKYVGHIICVSNAVKENLLSQGISEEKLHVIYNGIDIDKFNPNAEGLHKKGLNAAFKNEAGFNVGIIARLSYEKGVDFFLEAARLTLNKIPDSKFFIAGNGFLKDELIKKADSLGIGNSVYFLGFVGDNLVSFINELDAVVFPSLKEGLPLSLIESMSMEKVVIVSDAGGMPEVVEDGKNGFIVKSGDIEGIYQKIVFVYNNKTIMEKMGVEARKTVTEKFNTDIMADKTEDLFKTILPAPLSHS
ncbi:MAG: glycosyltransferase family 4 protein [Deltaproteobacteria bacterium]|jgi:glycosyltransferase involved in cell wall biosynthesis|nr:glycosyltransferase family 4 protein [Deltaproteobacteria bacterium]